FELIASLRPNLMTDSGSVSPRSVFTPSLNLITNSSTAALLGAQTRSFFGAGAFGSFGGRDAGGLGSLDWRGAWDIFCFVIVFVKMAPTRATIVFVLPDPGGL